MKAFQVLGVEVGADEQAIKRAYSRLIKQYRPDTHPVEFAEIRHAYEEAMNWLRSQQVQDIRHRAEAIVTPQSVHAEALAETHTTPARPVQRTVTIERNIAQEMVIQLGQATGQASEQTLLAKYREQVEPLQSLTLDQQMEYERILLGWFLNAVAPPLLAFSAANERYGWLQNRIAIERAFGLYAGRRLEALQRLSIIYSNILGKQNSLVQAEFEVPKPRKWLISHYEDTLAQEMISVWRRECSAANFESLHSRLSYTVPLPRQVYWVDIALGILVAVVGLQLAGKNAGWEGWLMPILIGAAMAALPVTLRVVAHWVNEGLMRLQYGPDFLHYAFIRVLVFGMLIIFLGSIYVPAMTALVALLLAYYSWGWIYDVVSYLEGAIIRGGKKIYGKISASRIKKAQREQDRKTVNWLGLAALALYVGIMFLGVYLSTRVPSLGHQIN